MPRSLFFGLPVVAATILFALLLAFRFQYVKSGYRTDRVDRFTGAVCTMPCLPPTPAPTQPPPELQEQKAIAAVKGRTDAALIVGEHSSDPQDTYEWGAVQSKTIVVSGNVSDDSSYVVCYCNKSMTGFRWEVHLASGDVFYMNDNANLSHTYGLTVPSPSPSPTEVQTEAAEESSSGSESTLPNSSKAAVVQTFYKDISARNFKSAYALLSQRYKRGTNYDQFVSGYETTLSVSATTAESTSDQNSVDVTLQAEDSKNGSIVETNYVGSWTLVSDGSGGWLLDTGKFTH